MDRLSRTVLIALVSVTAFLAGCEKNAVPGKPSIPDGPTSGNTGTEYTFTSLAEDADGDDVAIRFQWGDGDTSDWSGWQESGDSISMAHSWSDPGTYTVRSQAQDSKEAVSPWSSTTSITIGTTAANNPPGTPTTPIGDSAVPSNAVRSFVSTATDPDGDGVAIRFSWGDGDTSDWSELVPSGDSVSASHTWSDTGTYNIRAQARDGEDAASAWSAGHAIRVLGIGWTKILGGAGDDVGSSVDVTTDGGYIIAGWTYSYGAGQSDVYLIKTDANGDTGWTRTFGGSDYDEAHSVQQTTDGGYIITGSTRSDGAGEGDVYLIKVDSSGNETWHKPFGGSSSDVGMEVQQTTDGGYIIAGWSYSNSAGQDDVYLVKTGATGAWQWYKRFGGQSYDEGYSVQQTADGGFVATGMTYSRGAGESDVWLIKTDADGETLWTRTFGGSARDQGSSVKLTPDGGYIIAGRTKSYGTGGYDVYLIKTDANGVAAWQRTFGGADDDFGSSVQLALDGGYIITGTTTTAQGQDVYLVKVDANGEKLWDRTLGSASTDQASSVQRHYESFIMTGNTRVNSNYDVLLIKTDANGNVK